MIAKDRDSGLQPFCIVGNAGTTNSGAFDNLNSLADVAQEEDMWFHVDAAFGYFVSLSTELKHLVAGIERADSVALDFHKWMQTPYGVGAALIRDKECHRTTFEHIPDYLVRQPSGPAGNVFWFMDYSIELSRRFLALKLWMSFKEHGTEAIGKIVDQNYRQARYLVSLINKTPELELVVPCPTIIICFRYVLEGKSDHELNKLNQDILVNIQKKGVSFPSYTTLEGKYCIRSCFVQHRVTIDDVDILYNEVLRAADECKGKYL